MTSDAVQEVLRFFAVQPSFILSDLRGDTCSVFLFGSCDVVQAADVSTMSQDETRDSLCGTNFWERGDPPSPEEPQEEDLHYRSF